ncbi:MAG TPA: helix-turn-helix domain-containing protein [Bauldia sp.]
MTSLHEEIRNSEASPHAVDVTRAAQYLGVSASYLNRLRTTGGGPTFIKIGSRVTYRPADLDGWQAQHACTSTSDDRR